MISVFLTKAKKDKQRRTTSKMQLRTFFGLGSFFIVFFFTFLLSSSFRRHSHDKSYISITVFKQDIETIAECNLYHQDSLISPKDDFTNRVFPKKNI